MIVCFFDVIALHFSSLIFVSAVHAIQRCAAPYL